MNTRASTSCFAPVAAEDLPNEITTRADHPVPKLGITTRQPGPISTNKFYANLFLGSQDQGIWTHPYSLSWSKGGGNLRSWGMAISHIDADQRAYGPQNNAIPGSPVQYFINPVGIQSIILSAVELGPSTTLTSNSLQPFSANAILSPQPGVSSYIIFPLVQGMGFITAIYVNLMPAIQSSIVFGAVIPKRSPRPGIFKYHIMLEDGKHWLVYATPGNGEDPHLQLVSKTQVQGLRGWCGVIQVSKNPAGSAGELPYDESAGVYATQGSVSASVSGTTGTYQIEWSKDGFGDRPLLMYALPHHIQSFASSTAKCRASLQLQTTTKGVATAMLADSWTMIEASLPIDMSFAPWTPTLRSQTAISSSAAKLIHQIAIAEIQEDFNAQTNLDSMYFSGKAMSKFAVLTYAIRDLLHDSGLAEQGLAKLKEAFSRFVNNTQIFPLVYDSVWGGVVSSGAYLTGDPNQDFGNTHYNDHHFHYGYFVHAAAIIGYLDPSWLDSNKHYINTLVRDASNPSTSDPLFPFSRTFDWYHGHSFAKGLFENADSKDNESSSEDAFFSYALKMWGMVTGDASMEARGNLMLAVQARTLDNYFLLRRDNVNQPANFIANKVTGILFENKVDHTTYFGANPEFIQGIHMLPLLPYTTLTRSPKFITEEWASYFSPTSFAPATTIGGGWRGILYGNLACVDPATAWEFFARGDFDRSWMDGGVSRTWYLVFAAALGGL